MELSDCVQTQPLPLALLLQLTRKHRNSCSSNLWELHHTQAQRICVETLSSVLNWYNPGNYLSLTGNYLYQARWLWVGAWLFTPVSLICELLSLSSSSMDLLLSGLNSKSNWVESIMLPQDNHHLGRSLFVSVSVSPLSLSLPLSCYLFFFSCYLKTSKKYLFFRQSPLINTVPSYPFSLQETVTKDKSSLSQKRGAPCFLITLWGLGLRVRFLPICSWTNTKTSQRGQTGVLQPDMDQAISPKQMQAYPRTWSFERNPDKRIRLGFHPVGF